MSSRTLNLFFPQWQGSSAAHPQRLARGAHWLQALFPKRDFVAVGADSAGVGSEHIDPERRSGERAGVRAHAELLAQLTNARSVLATAQAERVLTLGGDCSVDAAPVAYLNQRYPQELAVLWLDAHPDLNTPESSPSGAFHGMVLRTLLGEGDETLLEALGGRPLEPEQVVLLGVRTFDPPEQAYIERVGLWHVTVGDVEANPEHLIDTLKGRGFRKIHLHFDLDVLDPAVFAATGYPTPSGLSVEGAAQLLQRLEAAFDIVGVTVTEYMPRGDEASEQAVLAALASHLPRL